MTESLFRKGERGASAPCPEPRRQGANAPRSPGTGLLDSKGKFWFGQDQEFPFPLWVWGALVAAAVEAELPSRKNIAAFDGTPWLLSRKSM